VAQFSFIPSGEARELADDVRELFEDLAAHLPHEHRAYSGECHPTLDVLETDEAVEVVVDVSGIPAGALRVLFRAGVLLIAGEKAPPRAAENHSFHLVEREFGRFARAVRLTGAFNVGIARASLDEGELTIVLPKLIDRRDQAHRIPVTAGQP
jgi:HSP20 family protein